MKEENNDSKVETAEVENENKELNETEKPEAKDNKKEVKKEKSDSTKSEKKKKSGFKKFLISFLVIAIFAAARIWCLLFYVC